jgi:4'-phosphopantetheinyl transferase EntD
VIEHVLPTVVSAVETRTDPSGIELFPEEEAALGDAVEKRRREFTTVRGCARAAFAELGLPPRAIVSGEHGEPLWPAGIVGSMTHCDGYRACALAEAGAVMTVGIDAEPNLPLPAGLLPDVARPEELGRLRELARAQPGICWDRLLFSAKESVYKAWFPLARRWLGFEDASLRIDPRNGTFSAKLLVIGPLVEGVRVTGFSGRWVAGDGLLLTAIALPAPSGEPPAQPA